MINMALLWIPTLLLTITALLAFLIINPATVPILAISAFGLFLIICAKWRLYRSKQMATFGYGRLTQSEKMFYLAGYFFIACSFFTAVYVSMVGGNP